MIPAEKGKKSFLQWNDTGHIYQIPGQGQNPGVVGPRGFCMLFVLFGFFFVSFGVLFVLILVFVGDDVDREKEHKIRWVEKLGGSRKSWGRGNKMITNILYKKFLNNNFKKTKMVAK